MCCLNCVIGEIDEICHTVTFFEKMYGRIQYIVVE